MKTNNTPEIRFKMFTGEWIQCRLGNMYDIASGYAFKKNDYTQEGIPIINGESIQHNNISTQNLNFLPVSFLDSYQNVILHTDDIVLGLNRPITNGDLKIAQIPKELDGSLLYQRAGKIIILNNTNIDFSYQLLLNEVHEFVLKKSVGSDQPFISTLNLKKWLLFTPDSEMEEERIGSFFKQLDNNILLQKQVLDNLKKTKQGFLQKMFPKEGECFPKIRFSGFLDDWKKCKLKDIAEFNPTTNLPDEFEYVDLESILGTNLVSHRTEKKETAPSRAQRLAKRGDVFFQTVRPYQKNNYLFDLPFDNYVFSTGYAQMRPYIHSYFLLSRLQEEKFVSNVLNRSTGTSYPAINSKNLSEIQINIPKSKEEQTKIGNLFKQLDATINLHQQELEALQETKQGFLQKMFV